jgi:response regulator RpfG family c-di-GMP phosphodiesterase
MTERILFVDDEPNVLQAIRRQLRGAYEVSLAGSGREALETLDREEPFAVVVSDLRMPEMDGVTLLEEVRKRAPDTVRMMLTGQADLQAAMNAINCSQIFRFATKPVGPTALKAALDASVEQHRLIVAERDLIENTLTAAIRALVDVLELVNPVAFGRATSLRAYVGHAAQALGLEDTWRYEVAAMLSQVGCVTLPPDLVQRVFAGQPVDDADRALFDSHPETAHRILGGIPRLESAAEIVAAQHATPAELEELDETVAIGARLIRIGLLYDARIREGSTSARAVAAISSNLEPGDLAVAQAFEGAAIDREDMVVRTLSLAELKTGMLLDEDVLACNELLLMTCGQEITSAMLERLKNFARGIGVREPIRVRIPASLVVPSRV